MLGHGDPIRVKTGERVLFHIVNGSATEIRSLALPGHSLEVIALDGNPIPAPKQAPVLWLGTAERISAVVEMNHPGVWVMGDLADDDRTAGIMKDVAMLGGYQEVEVDFAADNPGLTLFHCHQQLHMDFGFMALFDYA